MTPFRILLCAGLLAASASDVLAQDTGHMGNPEGRHWSLGLGAWGTGLEGSTGTGPFAVPVDASLSDILDEPDFALMGHLEFHSDSHWGFFTDLMFMDLSSSATVPAGRVTSRVDLTVLEAAGMYNLATQASPFDVFLGFRYWDVDTAIAFNAGIPGAMGPGLPPSGVIQTSGTDWTDLMFGARYAPRIGENGWLVFRGDYATGDSDTANIAGHVLWRFNRSASLTLGWRYMDLDYSDGAGAARRALKLEFNGPVAAISFGL